MLICVARLHVKPLGVPWTEKIKRFVDSHVWTLKELSCNCYGRSFRTKENSLSAKKSSQSMSCKISSVSLNGISMYNTLCSFLFFLGWRSIFDTVYQNFMMSSSISNIPKTQQNPKVFPRSTCAFEEKVRLK